MVVLETLTNITNMNLERFTRDFKTEIQTAF